MAMIFLNLSSQLDIKANYVNLCDKFRKERERG
jgi:hypothetical protein